MSNTDIPTCYGWFPPENIYIEVDGEDVLVPEIDKYLMAHVHGSIFDNRDRMEAAFEVSKWVKSLGDKEVFASHQYFSDRWTWETGSPWDKFFWRVFETESNRRRDLMTDILDAIGRTSLMNKLVDIMGETDGDT